MFYSLKRDKINTFCVTYKIITVFFEAPAFSTRSGDVFLRIIINLSAKA